MNTNLSLVGNHLFGQMSGIKQKRLESTKKIRALFLEALATESFEVLKVDAHTTLRGFQIYALLSTSHAYLSASPPEEIVYLDILGCSSFIDGEKACRFLKRRLNPRTIDIHEEPIFFRSSNTASYRR